MQGLGFWMQGLRFWGLWFRVKGQGFKKLQIDTYVPFDVQPYIASLCIPYITHNPYVVMAPTCVGQIR